MANIELVIKIPESRYRLLQKQARTNSGREKLDEFAEAVLNGTPLPEGHGDLIDRNGLLHEAQADGAYGYVSAQEINDAETIIAAKGTPLPKRMLSVDLIIKTKSEG